MNEESLKLIYDHIKYEHWMIIKLNEFLDEIQSELEGSKSIYVFDDAKETVNTTGSSIGVISLGSHSLNSGEALAVKKNAYLESFLIHSRVLTEFFFFELKPNKYVRAKDIFPNGQWEQMCETSIPNFKEMKEYILSEEKVFTSVSSEIAHIVEIESQTTWDRERIFQYLNTISIFFLKQIG